MIKKMSLCKGRHKIPEAVDGAIFETEVNPLAVDKLEQEAVKMLEGVTELHLYVTGLTVALIAVLNAARVYGIKVTLFHFNRDTGSYYEQEVK